MTFENIISTKSIEIYPAPSMILQIQRRAGISFAGKNQYDKDFLIDILDVVLEIVEADSCASKPSSQ